MSMYTHRNQLKVKREMSRPWRAKWLLRRGSFSATKSFRTRWESREGIKWYTNENIETEITRVIKSVLLSDCEVEGKNFYARERVTLHPSVCHCPK